MPQRQIAGMERASQLKIALYGLGIAAAVAVSVALFSWGLNLWSAAEIACQTKRDAMEMTKSNGCLEFWVNRYQALISAIIAAAIALYVVRPVFRQLGEVNRQSAVAARQVVLSKIDAYSAEIAAIELIAQSGGTIAGYLKNLNVTEARHQRMLQLYDETFEAAGALRKHAAIIDRYADSEAALKLRTTLRRRYLNATEALSVDASDFANRLRNNIFFDNFAVELIRPEADAIVRASLNVDAAGQALKREISDAVARAWLEVHRLETIVRGGSF